jgi:hypothetical protein
MTVYEEGQKAFESYLDGGMAVEVDNPYPEQSNFGNEWQKGFDDARVTYLR